MRTICFVVGARPNFVKSAPVIHALQQAGLPPLVIHTGQHYDRPMSDVFISELGLSEPDVYLGIGSGTHAEQTAKALVGIEEALRERRPRLVVVPGDVNSTLAGALAAVKLQIPVCHLEAGLRSFDWSMPEEHNRRLTDHMSHLLLVHSASALENLADEGIRRNAVLVGNTMIDSLLRHTPVATEREPWLRFGVALRDYVLVTLHRPALVDKDDLLSETVDALIELAASISVIFAVHPRTLKHLELGRHLPRLRSANVHVTEALPYLDFLGLEAGARGVVTDSGGVQEETSVLDVPCFTIRDSTERPVTVELGTNTVLGARPERIAEVGHLLRTPKRGQTIPLWDGTAGHRAADVLLEFLGDV